MVIIKEIPEDFQVEEIINLEEKNGDYLYVKLVKKNWNTLDVVKKLVNILGVKRKAIGFAGSKDRNAVTTQYISLQRVSKERLEKITIKDVKLTPLFYSDKPITLGSLNGNKFKIIVRNVECKVGFQVKFLENYFGEQRFSKNNAQVGKLILKRKFEEACSLIDNKNVSDHLTKHINDYVGALRQLDKKLLSLYLHAYQSYLFNEVLSKFLTENYPVEEKVYSLGTLAFTFSKVDKISLPLLSFDTEFGDPRIEEIYLSLMKKEKIALRDFIIREIPDLISESVERDAVVEVKGFNYNYLNDKTVELEFNLPKGAYATMLIKKLF